MRDHTDRQVTPPKRVTSPTWVPHSHENRIKVSGWLHHLQNQEMANLMVKFSQKATPLSKHNLSNFETKSPTYLASSANAMIPDAIDADTEVAEKVAIQVPFKSEVI